MNASAEFWILPWQESGMETLDLLTLLSKGMDWFLCDRDLLREKVNNGNTVIILNVNELKSWHIWIKQKILRKCCLILEILVVVTTAWKVPVFVVIMVCIFSAFPCIWTEYGELRISPYSVRMYENAGKMQTRITPSTDTFYAVHYCQIIFGYMKLDLMRHFVCKILYLETSFKT